MSACPCGTGKSYEDCCGPYIAGTSLPPTAEALMRSRYSAFGQRAVDYLHDTLAPEARHDFDRKTTEQLCDEGQWEGLEIRTCEAGGTADEAGTVEFVATYKHADQPVVHHETGTFRKEDGRWYYVDGHMGPQPRRVVKIGRNDPCLCGSGKKYKKCCGAAA